MAEIKKKVLTNERLKTYDTKIKEKIAEDDTTTLDSAKSYTDTTTQAKVNELKNGQVKTNTDAITKLNGDVQVVGSVDQKIDTVKKELEGKIESGKYDDTALAGRVSKNETAIATLNGTGVGSVDKKVADAVAKIVADAPEAYNTLKEISDWISNHETSASGMNSQITTNKVEIAKVAALVGTLPDGTPAKTVIEYIDSKVGGVDFTAQIAAAKQEAISTAAGDATTKANKALADAKEYADGLSSNYATADQGAKADTALQKESITSGSINGSISVGGTNVSVKGLASAAYAETSQFDAAGTATTKVKELSDGQVTTNKNDITALKTKVETLETNSFEEITEDEILALFN